MSADKHYSLACLLGADQIWQADYRAGNRLSLMSFLRNCDPVTSPMGKWTAGAIAPDTSMCDSYRFQYMSAIASSPFWPLLPSTWAPQLCCGLLMGLSAFSNICFSLVGLKQPSTWLVEWRKAVSNRPSISCARKAQFTSIRCKGMAKARLRFWNFKEMYSLKDKWFTLNSNLNLGIQMRWNEYI